MSDRVNERRRAAQLARRYRDQENLTIAEIARRLGRAPATVKAYLHDPSDDNKSLQIAPQERQFWAPAGHARTSICKPLLGSRCDGTRPAFPTAQIVRQG
jgi:predicted transcriptional regulator